MLFFLTDLNVLLIIGAAQWVFQHKMSLTHLLTIVSIEKSNIGSRVCLYALIWRSRFRLAVIHRAALGKFTVRCPLKNATLNFWLNWFWLSGDNSLISKVGGFDMHQCWHLKQRHTRKQLDLDFQWLAKPNEVAAKWLQKNQETKNLSLHKYSGSHKVLSLIYTLPISPMFLCWKTDAAKSSLLPQPTTAHHDVAYPWKSILLRAAQTELKRNT